MARLLLGLVGGAILSLSASAEDSTSVARANQTLQLAGLPGFPQPAEKLKCQSWNGQGAGIYAAFVLKKTEDLSAYLSSLPPDLMKATPIPGNLLSPPLAETPWFTPPNSAHGYVLYRDRIWHSAPEKFRLYVDPDKSAIYLYYTWNNKRIF